MNPDNPEYYAPSSESFRRGQFMFWYDEKQEKWLEPDSAEWNERIVQRKGVRTR